MPSHITVKLHRAMNRADEILSTPQPAPDERKVEPSPLTDEELEQLREIEAKDAAEERKGDEKDMPASGFGERHEAWRYRQIHPLVDQMGGWANARYWIQRHAKEYFRTCENLEAEIARLKAPTGPTREQVEIVKNITSEMCPNCKSTEFMVARDMIGTRHCVRCHHQWLPLAIRIKGFAEKGTP